MLIYIRYAKVWHSGRISLVQTCHLGNNVPGYYQSSMVCPEDIYLFRK